MATLKSDPWSVHSPIPKQSTPLTEEEQRVARTAMLVTVGTLGIFFAVRVILQDLLSWGAAYREDNGSLLVSGDELVIRAMIEFMTAGVGFLLVILMKPGVRARFRLIASILVIAVLTALFKTGAKLLVGLHDISYSDERISMILELINTTIVVALIIILGMIIARMRWRALRSENQQVQHRERLVKLLSASQSSELELRERLSGNVYSSLERLFVTVEAQLNHLASTVADETDLIRREKRLRGIALELARMRTGELRTLTSAVFPINLSIGLGSALQALIDQLPPYVTPQLDFEDACAELEREQIEKVHAVLLTRTTEIGLHLAARRPEVRNVSLAVRYDRTSRLVTVRIEDDGKVVDVEVRSSALALIRLQAEVYDGSISIEHATPHNSIFLANFTLPLTPETGPIETVSIDPVDDPVDTEAGSLPASETRESDR